MQQTLLGQKHLQVCLGDTFAKLSEWQDLTLGGREPEGVGSTQAWRSEATHNIASSLFPKASRGRTCPRNWGSSDSGLGGRWLAAGKAFGKDLEMFQLHLVSGPLSVSTGTLVAGPYSLTCCRVDTFSHYTQAVMETPTKGVGRDGPQDEKVHSRCLLSFSLR